jgi:hypothetical protein
VIAAANLVDGFALMPGVDEAIAQQPLGMPLGGGRHHPVGRLEALHCRRPLGQHRAAQAVDTQLVGRVQNQGVIAGEVR